MNSNATDEISTTFFGNAKCFNIRNGRFRTIAGNSYTGCLPAQQHSASTASSPTKIKTTYFEGASEYEILDGDFDTIRGDAIDFPAPQNDSTKNNSEFLQTRGHSSRDSVPVRNVGDELLKVRAIVHAALDEATSDEDDTSSPESA